MSRTFVFAFGLFHASFTTEARTRLEQAVVPNLGLSARRWWIMEISPDYTRIYLRSIANERKTVELPSEFVWNPRHHEFELSKSPQSH